ncbi:hypothetical protein [Muricoccus pecuniae]|uniref:Uncharacterized protein n=1 Tax=Muricoccus pecuniae TaxID=693023 RepID=A0A840YM72_9PROT|nr:hypothetical protein [Roseomonas pecuniae]MBB5696043.1 hypothetical protein [Roseomonas pecuniae]
MSQGAPPAEAVTYEDLAEAVASAQAEISEAVRRAELTRDPYRFVLGALFVSLGLFPRLVERMEEAAEAARVPMTSEEKAAFRRDVRDGLRQEAGNLARATTRRTALLAGAALALTALAGVGGGYLLGRSSVREEVAALNARLALPSDASRAWLELMRANPDPRPAIAAGAAWQDPATQRRAVEFRLWTDPPPATAPPRR